LRRIFLLILPLLLLSGPAAASEVLVVQGVRSALYEEVVQGFRGACPAQARTLVLADYSDADLARVVREERPHLVVAVGDGALAALRKIRKTPVLAVMALGVAGQKAASANLTGVDLLVKPEQYLSLFKRIKARRIGVIHDPARTGGYLKQARAAAAQFGMELVVREVATPRQALAQLETLKGVVDSLWVLPDTTAVTLETLEAYFLFSQGESIPVISFSAAHLKLGALLALEVDRGELGRQAGEMARQLLRGEDPATLELASPRRVRLVTNNAIARRLNYPSELMQSLSVK
jgi:putative tryptophan/tyrosine transport system substrate-binding protein